jgi:hypothetical protein
MITIITSLYRTDAHIDAFIAHAIKVATELQKRNVAFEHLIIANDPTQKEKQIEAKLAHCPWIIWHNIPRETLYATWNRGVRMARGNACTFWNVDDVRTVAGIVEAEKRITQGTDLVYFPFIYKRYVWIGPFKILAKRKVFTPPIFERERFIREMHNGPFFAFAKSLFEKIGPFDETFKIAGDFDWSSRAAQVTTFTRSLLIAGTFTNDGRTLSGSKSELHTQEVERILKSILEKQ